MKQFTLKRVQLNIRFYDKSYFNSGILSSNET